MPVIAYYRVSTAEQGFSGLGIGAQQAVLLHYAAISGETIRDEVSEILSRREDRPEYRTWQVQHKDTLPVARLNRLSRDLNILTSLQKSGVKFISVDMPSAEKMVIQIMGVIAEYERDTGSAHTIVPWPPAKGQDGAN